MQKKGGGGGLPYKRLIKIMRKEKGCSAVSLLINSFIKSGRAQRAQRPDSHSTSQCSRNSSKKRRLAGNRGRQTGTLYSAQLSMQCFIHLPTEASTLTIDCGPNMQRCGWHYYTGKSVWQLEWYIQPNAIALKSKPK